MKNFDPFYLAFGRDPVINGGDSSCPTCPTPTPSNTGGFTMSASAGDSTFILDNDDTVTLGSISTPIGTSKVTLSAKTPKIGNNVNVKYSSTITKTTNAALETTGFSQLSVDVGLLNGGTLTVTEATTSVLKSVVLSGGNIIASVTLPATPTSITSIDASAMLSTLTSTLPAFTGAATVKGSATSVNTITLAATVPAALDITLGDAADTFTTGAGMASAVTVTGKDGADTYKYAVTDATPALLKITDFSLTADKISFASATSIAGLGAPVQCDSSAAAAAGAYGAVKTMTALPTATTYLACATAQAEFFAITTTATNPTAISGAKAYFSLKSAATAATAGSVPLVYINDSDNKVHIGVLKYLATAITASDFTDLFILDNVTSLTDLDASDLTVY